MRPVVKRAGHTEYFDPRKVYASVYAACLSLRVTVHEAEMIAERVTEEVKKWLAPKNEVTAHAISEHVAKLLKVYHPDAAYLYQSHRDVS